MTHETLMPRADAGWPLCGLLAMFLLVLLAAVVSADEVLWEDVELVESGNWKDPGGSGSHLRFDQSYDGDRLVLLGYASPNDVRVTDRDLTTLAVLVPPNEDPVVEGVRWSETGDWVCAWGTAADEDRDLLWLWDGTTYQPSDWIFENFTTPLHDLDSILFMSLDAILALSGRDENGTSRVLLVETFTSAVRRDFPWEDNATVVQLGTDTMRLVCVDDRGIVTTIAGSDWTEVEVLGGHDVVPSSDSLGARRNLPWIVGYEDGSAGFWGGNPVVLQRSADLGTDPIQAISWAIALDEGDNYYLVGTPSPSGGSELMAYYFDLERGPDNPASEPVEYTSPMTSMVGDAKVNGQVWIAFEDGAIRLLNVTVIHDLPPTITIEVPRHQKEYRENFTATGIVTDDHDMIEYVRVRSGDGFNWSDAEVVDGRWTFEVDVTVLEPDRVYFTVEAYDGRHRVSNITFFQVPKDNDEGGEWPRGIPMIPIAAAVIVLTIYYYRRRQKGMETGET